jgi:WD40 repeat protein
LITIIGLLVVIGPVAWLGIGLIEGLIAVLKGHEGAVWSAAFSSDGKRVVTASADKTARPVWALAGLCAFI